MNTNTKREGALLIAGLIVLSAMVVFVGTAAANDDPGFMFKGDVTDGSGVGMVGLNVEIENTRTHEVWTATTGTDGHYETDYVYYLTAEPVSGDYEMRVEGTPVATKYLTAADFEFDGIFWYIAHWSHIWDYQIPEFATIAMPVASILGLLFFFNYRKRRKE